MAKKIALSLFFGFVFVVWLFLLSLTHLFEIYNIYGKFFLFPIIWGGVTLFLLSFRYPPLTLLLTLYFISTMLALFIYKSHPHIFILCLPFIILFIVLVFKNFQIALLSSCFFFIFIFFIMWGSYNFIQLKAVNKCVFVKNDGHFVENSLKHYATMLKPIVIDGRIPTGALIVISDTKFEHKRWVLTASGKMVEVQKFSATLAKETICE